MFWCGVGDWAGSWIVMCSSKARTVVTEVLRSRSSLDRRPRSREEIVAIEEYSTVRFAQGASCKAIHSDCL